MTAGNVRPLVLLVLAPLLSSCAGDRLTADETGGEYRVPLVDVDPREPRRLRILTLNTPDGSGQTVHPDFAPAPSWSKPMLLAATPYRGGNTGIENPTLYSRGKGFDWAVVSDQSYPIATPTAGHLSDPDILTIPGTDELWVYYRQTDSRDRTLLVRTNDGVTYSAPVQVLRAKAHAIVSPTIVRRDSTRWRMWSVNANGGGCRAATTTVELRRSKNGVKWGNAMGVSLGRPGSFVWHLDVQWIPSRQEYWALYAAKTAGNCATTALFLATSTDGVTWHSYPAPVIKAGVIPEFADIVYRSTFAYDPTNDVVRLWYSGARVDANGFPDWRTAVERRDRSELFASIAGAATMTPMDNSVAAARFEAP